MVEPLVDGDPTCAQVDGASPRLALAATIFAFEKDPAKAPVINRTFKHFL